jgi:dihydroorotate dehydrogenase
MRRLYRVRAPQLETSVAGVDFESPVGLAAGFDKNALWFNALSSLGFGFVEVGTLTGHAQSGNPKPRVFRLPKDSALINRLGFNNRGSEAAAAALDGAEIEPTLGINIGKSKITPNEEAISDYLLSLERLYDYADYFAINVSSPNTQGLRDLQAADPLRKLLGGLIERNKELAAERGSEKKPVFVKIAPDMDAAARDEIVDLAIELGLDGIIATNTTIERDPLTTDADRVEAIGNGGLSGKPLTDRSRAFVSTLYMRAAGRLPIIGVGGIMNGDDAYEMLRAGASLVQVYTGFVYGGPGFITQIHRKILERMRADGHATIADVVGSSHVRH